MSLLTDKILAALFFILFFPLWPILYAVVRLTSKGPFIFRQKRMGKNKKVFMIYKIRTMIVGAEKLRKKYLEYNEIDGPVFKIRDDPRYTRIGKFLARTGLDEIPQFINVFKGEMAIVGPRPLPVEEALRITEEYSLRFSVLPGCTSMWVVKGAHKLGFKKWMELDLNYAKNKSLKLDLQIIFLTILLMLRMIIKTLL